MDNPQRVTLWLCNAHNVAECRVCEGTYGYVNPDHGREVPYMPVAVLDQAIERIEEFTPGYHDSPRLTGIDAGLQSALTVLRSLRDNGEDG